MTFIIKVSGWGSEFAFQINHCGGWVEEEKVRSRINREKTLKMIL